MPEAETTEEQLPNVEEPDTTERDLRTWGLSGQPSTWAVSTWTHVIDTIRAANRGDADAAAVQAELDAAFPDAGYQAANVVLPHPPTGEFSLEPGDDALSVHVVTPPDEDLDLSDDYVQWDWGDGTPLQNDCGCPDHTYAAPGTYGVRLSIYVGGARYGSGEEVTVGEDVPEDAPVVGSGDVNPGVLGRDATVFESDTDDDPNTTVSPDESEAQAEAVATYTATAPGESWAGPDDQTGVAQTPPDETADAEVFDPADHTVEEVLAYVDEHPEEADRIAEAEVDGKNRVTLIDRLT